MDGLLKSLSACIWIKEFDLNYWFWKSCTINEKLQLILNDLLNRDIIRPSESSYPSPNFLVRKNHSETRLCIDYHELNKITIKDTFPSPLIDDNIELSKNKWYFTGLDLKKGYYNMKIAEDSLKFTSFLTPMGQLESLFCPCGLKMPLKLLEDSSKRFFTEQMGDLGRLFCNIE